MPSALGEKIRRLRQEKRMTLDELGQAAGSSKSYVWELENRGPPRPSADKLQRIAAALGVTVEYLLDNEANHAPSEEVFDDMFYRKYKKLDATTKARVREIVEVWSKKG
jgi:transcriptional regulator with XRE-family HTH domain